MLFVVEYKYAGSNPLCFHGNLHGCLLDVCIINLTHVVITRMNISATPTHKKRKRIADTDEPHSKKPKEDIGSSISSTSAGFIQISNVDPEGKYVQIKNTSDEVSE